MNKSMSRYCFFLLILTFNFSFSQNNFFEEFENLIVDEEPVLLPEKMIFTQKILWGEKGLFSAQYAEENHFLFPSLKTVVEGIGEEKIFEGLELSADDWEEIEEYEYAFV